LLKFLSEFTVNMDHWATILDLHLHRGLNVDADPGPLGLPLGVFLRDWSTSSNMIAILSSVVNIIGGGIHMTI
jgi:hypothetical protein